MENLPGNQFSGKNSHLKVQRGKRLRGREFNLRHRKETRKLISLYKLKQITFTSCGLTEHVFLFIRNDVQLDHFITVTVKMTITQYQTFWFNSAPFSVAHSRLQTFLSLKEDHYDNGTKWWMREHYNLSKAEDLLRSKRLLHRKRNFVHRNYELWAGNSRIESKAV